MREAEWSEVGERDRGDRDGVRDRERLAESDGERPRRGDLDRLWLRLGDLEREGERLAAGDRGEVDNRCRDGEAALLLSRAPSPLAILCCGADIDPGLWYDGSATSSSELELRLGDLLCLLLRRGILRGFLGVEAESAPGRGACGSGVG